MWDESSGDAPAAPVCANVNRKRKFMGQDGQEWLVEERPYPNTDRRGGTHLVFSNAGIARRVRDFPKDWLALSDAELYRIGWSVLTEKSIEQK